MVIDRNLRLVVSVEREKSTIYCYSVPISREVFANYCMVLGKAFSLILSQGLNVATGPGMATLLLKRIAHEDGLWEGPEGVANGLLNEIRRLTTVIVPGKSGWETMLLQEAVDKKFFDEDELYEVMNAIVFFTCAWHILRKTSPGPLSGTLDAMRQLWVASTTSLSLMDYINSLPTLTEVGSSGAKAA